MVQITIKKTGDGKLHLNGHLHSGKKHLGSSRPIEIHNKTGEKIRVCFLTREDDKIVDYFINLDNVFVVDPMNDKQGWFEVPPSSTIQTFIDIWAPKAWGPDDQTHGPRGSKLMVGANPSGNACHFFPHNDDHVGDVVIDPGN